MDKKIKTRMVAEYTTTDDKSFVGPGSESRAINHQKHLDLLAERGVFCTHMCGLFALEFPNIESLNEAIENSLEHIADNAGDLANNIIDLFAFFGSDRWMRINTFLTKSPAKKHKEIKAFHNWTKETMGECAKIHMEDLAYWYYNGSDWRERINHIIQSYVNIENTLPK